MIMAANFEKFLYHLVSHLILGKVTKFQRINSNAPRVMDKSLNRFKEFREICFVHISAKFKYFAKQLILTESPDHVL